MTTDLIELAEIVEKATAEQQREMLEEAFYAVHGGPLMAQEMEREPQAAWIVAENEFLTLVRAGDRTGHYESAAMALVPEGWRAGFEEGGRYDGIPQPEAWCWPFGSDFDPDWKMGHEGYRSAPDGVRASAATPALALTAACLKARAASLQGEVSRHG